MKLLLVVASLAGALTVTPFVTAQDIEPAADVFEVDAKAEAYYYYCIARMHERQFEATQAIESYEEAARLDPESAYPHVALASLYQRTRQLDMALEAVKHAIELEPDVAAAQRILGMLYFAMLRNGGSPELAPQAIDAFRETVRLDPGDMDSRSSLARLLLASRLPDEAKEHLEEIVRFAPTSYHEMFLLARIKRGQGDTEAAIGLLKQSLSVEASQPEARNMIVELLRAEQRFDEMAEVYRGALEEVPADLDARVRLADALANGGQLDEAAKEFQTILDEDPKNVVVLVGLAMVRRDQVDFASAEEMLLEALAQAPNHVLGRYTLAGVYEQKREYQKAIDEWMKLLATDLNGQNADQAAVERKAEYLAHLGFAYEQLDRSEEAIDAFRKARDLSGGDERFLTFFVQGLLAAKKGDEAMAAIEEARERFPESERFEVLEARALEVQGEHERAVATALQLSEREPENEMFAQSVVEIYQQQKRFADAETFLRSRLDHVPESVTLRFQLGAILERQKKFDEAEAAFEAVLEIEPDSAATLNYLGYMLADQNRRLEESIAFIKRALAQDPHNGAYLDSLGWAYFRIGNLELAEENLLKAIASLRLTGVVYDHLGDLYLIKGNPDQAAQYWQKALEQDDDEVEKDKVVQKMKRVTSTP